MFRPGRCSATMKLEIPGLRYAHAYASSGSVTWIEPIPLEDASE